VRFDLTQRFAHDHRTVSQAYADPDLYPTLVGLPKLGGITVLDRDQASHDRVRLRIRFAFTGDLPTAATAIVDPARLTWVQESDHDLVSGRATFRLVPDHYPDRLQASGTFVVTPGQADGRATRSVSGELKVRALLVSGKVEQAIISGLAEYLAAEAPAVDAYVSGAQG